LGSRKRYFVKGVSCRIGNEAVPVVNLSSGGFFATTRALPTPGQSIELELLLEPEMRVRALGTVQWTKERASAEGLPEGFGVALTRIEPDDQKVILELLKRSDPTQGPAGSW
jgi:hypothetical protein